MKANQALIFILALSFCALVISGKDYYEILGVKRDATKKTIRRAYRELSLKYHPDKNPGDKTAEAKFIEIAQAYETLMDPEKRKIYDEHGEEGLKEQGRPQQHNPFDIFSNFGGFNFNFGHQQPRGKNRAADLVVPLTVSLDELYMGKIDTVLVSRMATCQKCGGTGARTKDDIKKCSRCGGTGRITQKHQFAPGFVQQTQAPCPACGGKGETIKRKCTACGGKKVTLQDESVTVLIERGMRDGDRITIPGMTDASATHEAGDLIFEVKLLPHETFQRDGHDLRMKMHVSLKEALIGFSRRIKHLDGHPVTINRSSITKPHQVLRVRGEGMPVKDRPSRTGDLLVEVVVDFPKQLDETAKNHIIQALN